MKIIDRYLIKQFLQTILFGILAFTLIFVVIDLMENLDDFIDHDVAFKIIIQYYVVFMPEIIKLMIPVAVLLAALFTVGKMSNQNELTSLKSSGMSLYRFMLPFVTTSVFISLFAVYFGGFVVPAANKHKLFIEQTYMKKGIVRGGINIFFQDSPTRIVSLAYFDPNRNLASRTSIQDFDPIDRKHMVDRIDATSMSFDTTTNTWILHKGIKRTFKDSLQSVKKFDKLNLNNLNFSPDDVIRKQQKTGEMTLTELKQFSKEQLLAGNDPTRVEIEYNSRIAFAFASIVVVLFGLPLSANKRRRGLAVQFGINLLITFIYLVFMKISQAFGKNGVLDPVLTAWSANIFFLLAAIVNIFRVQK